MFSFYPHNVITNTLTNLTVHDTYVSSFVLHCSPKIIKDYSYVQVFLKACLQLIL